MMMQPLCLVSTDTGWQQQQIAGVRALHHITDSNLHQIVPAPSIGIDTIRDLQQLVSRKPYGGGERLIVLSDMEKATIEAQNALLKLLEEPPEETSIIITTGKEEALLPTIRSRCRTIRHATASTETADQLPPQVRSILSARPGERILLAQDIAKTKEDTLTFLSSLIRLAQRQLHQPAAAPEMTLLQWATILKNTEHARQYVERNVNFKATLDILFLGFPKVA